MKKSAWIRFMASLMALLVLGCALPALGEEVLSPETTEAAEIVRPDYGFPMLENAVSIRIGRDGQTEFSIDMYDHGASATMLNYLSANALLFPTYTYEEEVGFVAQSIRGDYSRDAETTIVDIHAGELYLFSGGQLRLYFKDVPEANISATPVGYVTNAETLTQAVQNAYTSNLGDTWGVDVYFWITRNIE